PAEAVSESQGAFRPPKVIRSFTSQLEPDPGSPAYRFRLELSMHCSTVHDATYSSPVLWLSSVRCSSPDCSQGECPVRSSSFVTLRRLLLSVILRRSHESMRQVR